MHGTDIGHTLFRLGLLRLDSHLNLLYLSGHFLIVLHHHVNVLVAVILIQSHDLLSRQPARLNRALQLGHSLHRCLLLQLSAHFGDPVLIPLLRASLFLVQA